MTKEKLERAVILRDKIALAKTFNLFPCDGLTVPERLGRRKQFFVNTTETDKEGHSVYSESCILEPEQLRAIESFAANIIAANIAAWQAELDAL